MIIQEETEVASSSFTQRRGTEISSERIACLDASELDGGAMNTNIEAFPIVKIPIAVIADGVTLRRSGPSLQHVRALAESDEPLPPVLVQRATMSVIDGAHRLLAARMRGNDEIDVRFFDGDKASCFVMAVRANVTHGLPLSLADRKAAATKIVRLYPNWSDRMIASVSGLAAGTVAGLRDRSKTEDDQLDGRVGRDGRERPANPAERRRMAAEIINEHPEASLREVAEKAGISPETVRKVRLRLRNGEVKSPDSRLNEGIESSALHSLRRDPALSSRQQGRLLLRMLSALDVLEDQGDAILQEIPVYDLKRVAEAARACSRAWERFADLADHQNIAAYEAEGPAKAPKIKSALMMPMGAICRWHIQNRSNFFIAWSG
jgi:ParB-like chromosome segregation protein Spo0J